MSALNPTAATIASTLFNFEPVCAKPTPLQRKIDDVDTFSSVYPQIEIEPCEDFFGCSNNAAYAQETVP
jgi:hypothetical protein